MSNQPTKEDMARDLTADLAVCKAAPAGPWAWEYQTDSTHGDIPSFVDWWGAGFNSVGEGKLLFLFQGDSYGGDDTPTLINAGGVDSATADFIRAARDGWEVAIRRTLAAEARVRELERGMS